MDMFFVMLGRAYRKMYSLTIHDLTRPLVNGSSTYNESTSSCRRHDVACVRGSPNGTIGEHWLIPFVPLALPFLPFPPISLPMVPLVIKLVPMVQMLTTNNSNLTNFLHSDWLFGRLYTSIKAMRKNTQFSP